MEDGEEFSRSPAAVDAVADDNDEQEAGSPRSDSPEPSNGRITVTLALPIQNHRSTPSSGAAAVGGGGGGGGGGREDCWSEEATAALIEAWGERYSEQSRGILKQKHWEEVAGIVNASAGAGAGKPARTDVQCKNRMDTVKRKYKSEKAKIATGAGPSAWIFFDRLDRLLGNPNSASAAKFFLPATSKQPTASPIPRRSHGFLLRAKRPVSLAEDSEWDSDSSDSLPPATHHNQRSLKRQKMDFDSPPPPPRPPRFDGGGRAAAGAVSGEGQGRVNEWRNSLRELTRVIFMFSQAYEHAESEKLQQMVEMEKQRMKFAKELEIQRMKFLMKTQLQLSRLSRVGQQGRHVSDENNNVNNNSDCSN